MRNNMEKNANSEPNGMILALSGNIDMSETITFRDDLMRALAEGRPVRVDAGTVNRVGTPAIQVMLAGFRSAQAEGVSFVLAAASEVVRSAFEDLGLNNELNMMLAAR